MKFMANWLSKMGIQSYRIRASGHYYPYQLKAILNVTKPKEKIEAIHTERPELFYNMVKKSIGAKSSRRKTK